MTVFDITIYLDTICPWCYIGDKILNESIGLYQKTYPGGSKDTFSFTFLPYYLKPEISGPSVPIWDRAVEKNGDVMSKGIRTRLERVGRAHGIDFAMKSKVGNTRDSHRLIQWAGAKNATLQKDLVDRIYHSVFEGEMDLSSHKDLADAAAAVGLPREEAFLHLESMAGTEKVDAMAAEARARGVNSVPTVLINGKRIEGAEDASTFYEAFANAKSEAEGVHS